MAIVRVEVAGRLVGPHDRGLGDEGAGDGDALLLTAGQLVRTVLRAVAEPDAIEHRRCAARVPRSISIPLSSSGSSTFSTADSTGIRLKLWKMKPMCVGAVLGARPVAHLVDVVALDMDGAAVDVVEARQAVEQRRLAATRRPHDGHEFTGLDAEVDVVQRWDFDDARAVHLGDALRRRESEPWAERYSELRRDARFHLTICQRALDVVAACSRRRELSAAQLRRCAHTEKRAIGCSASGTSV